MGRAPTPKKKATRARAERKPTETKTTPCPVSGGPLGVVHDALARGDYGAYVTGLLQCGASYAEHGCATPDQFVAAVHAWKLIEQALISPGPPVRWQRERLLAMGRIARGLDRYDAELVEVRNICGSLLRATEKNLDGSCERIRALLATVRPEFASLDVEIMTRLVRAEQAKRQPGPASLAAALWNAAGIARKRSKDGAAGKVTNLMINRSASDERKRAIGQNDA